MAILLDAEATFWIARAGFKCVYAIGPSEDGPLKIGHASDLRLRLRDINIGNWADLEIHAAYLATRAGLACDLERAMHQKLKRDKRHIRGEWFRINLAEFHQEALPIVAKMGPKQIVDIEGRTGNILRYCRDKSRSEWNRPPACPAVGPSDARI